MVVHTTKIRPRILCNRRKRAKTGNHGNDSVRASSGGWGEVVSRGREDESGGWQEDGAERE